MTQGTSDQKKRLIGHFAKAYYEIDLQEWQLEIIDRVLSGEEILVSPGRRRGMTNLRKIIEDLQSRPDPGRNKTTTGATHPDTSREAAERALPKSGTQRRRVLEVLLSEYPGGLTNEEIRDRLEIPYGSTLARRNELMNDGWVEDSGDRRDTEAGSSAIVWRAIP